MRLAFCHLALLLFFAECVSNCSCKTPGANHVILVHPMNAVDQVRHGIEQFPSCTCDKPAEFLSLVPKQEWPGEMEIEEPPQKHGLPNAKE